MQNQSGAETPDPRGTLSREISAYGAKLQPGFSSNILGLDKTLTMDISNENKEGAHDISMEEVNEIEKTLGKYSEKNKNEIVQTYEEINDVIHQLDTLHSAII